MTNDVSGEPSGREHWDAVYRRGEIERLGWHEDYPAHSIEMIDRCRIQSGSLVLDVGSGASTLVPYLLGQGDMDLVAVDISAVALERARERLADETAARVTWIVADVLRPDTLGDYAGRVSVWHDRALFHFLIEDADRERYLGTLRRLVRPGGYVIIASFSPRGADRCSGLPVRRYDAKLISDAVGPEFGLQHSFECDYVMPSGDVRPYVYTLFERTKIAG